MADLSSRTADWAQAMSERERDAAIGRARASAEAAGSPECEDCGAAIPEARRKAWPAATRCVFCQSRSEGKK